MECQSKCRTFLAYWLAKLVQYFTACTHLLILHYAKRLFQNKRHFTFTSRRDKLKCRRYRLSQTTEIVPKWIVSTPTGTFLWTIWNVTGEIRVCGVMLLLQLQRIWVNLNRCIMQWWTPMPLYAKSNNLVLSFCFWTIALLLSQELELEDR